jgi:hypothetical protein
MMTVQTTRKPYVYAVLLGTSVLKVGYSTEDYERVALRALNKAKSINLTFDRATVIWHRDADQSFELFLRWCADRYWGVVPQTGGFYVGGEDLEQIAEKLDNWFRLGEDIDQLDSSDNEDD